MKQRPGLPEDFRFSLSEKDLTESEPAEVGDFFDEDVPVPGRDSSEATKVVPIRVPSPPSSTETVQETQAPAKPPQPQKPRPRRQVNMTAEVEQMVDDLLQDISLYSRERNPAASDLFHALVALAHAARKELSLSEVPRRGRWGSPTVKVFQDSLKAAFKAAIALQYRPHSAFTYLFF